MPAKPFTTDLATPDDPPVAYGLRVRLIEQPGSSASPPSAARAASIGPNGVRIGSASDNDLVLTDR